MANGGGGGRGGSGSGSGGGGGAGGAGAGGGGGAGGAGEVEAACQRVVGVACGMNHSAAVLESGELVTFGRGESGQLGHGDNLGRGVPALVQAMPPLAM